MARVRNMQPVDQGYAWVVLGSCFVLRLLMDGFWGSIGILLLQWGRNFDVKATDTAWLGSMLTMLIFCCTKVSAALANRFTYRLVVIGGGIVVSTCLFVMSLATSLLHIYMLMPVLGIGMGLAYLASHVAYIPFFNQRFALASCIVNAAAGVGFLAISPFLEFLVSAYGINGALMILSATMANICVCGLLLRPFNSSSNNSSSNSNKETETACTWACSKTNDKSKHFRRAVARTFDLYLFTKVRFLSLSIISGFMYASLHAFIINIYPFAVSIGVPNFQSAFLTSVVGIGILIVRLIPLAGVLVDKKYISPAALAGVAFFVAGADIILIQTMTTFSRLFIFVSIYGCAHGIGGTFLIMVVVYSAGSKDKASGTVSWFLFSIGMGNLVWIYISGLLYDRSGSYRIPMAVCGVVVTCIGVILLIDLFLQRKQQRHTERTEDSPDPQVKSVQVNVISGHGDNDLFSTTRQKETNINI